MKLKSLCEFPDRVSPMTEDETGVFFSCYMAEKRGVPVNLDDEKAPVALVIIRDRLREMGRDANISPWAMMFVASLCDRPGLCVMWAYALARLVEKTGRATMETLACEFPEGFPLKEAQHECWQAQKGGANGRPDIDNCFDHPEYWQVSGPVPSGGNPSAGG